MSVKVTVPAAVEGDTVAVSVTLVPTVAVPEEGESVVAVVVGPDELPERLDPQPAAKIVINVRNPDAVIERSERTFISNYLVVM